MTRRLPEPQLASHGASALSNERLVEDIFRNAASWEKPAAFAALYTFRPDLRRGMAETEAEILAHQIHLMAWPVNPYYFGRVCRLLAVYGIGGHW
jgi:hypothetical protein